MRIIIDTNVIMDILLKREPFFEASYGALRQAIARGDDCLVSASAVTDIYYLLHKSLKDTAIAKAHLERLFRLLSVADVLSVDIQSAISSDISDYEDAVVHAVALREKADYIVTRNVKDYVGSVVAVVRPADL